MARLTMARQSLVEDVARVVARIEEEMRNGTARKMVVAENRDRARATEKAARPAVVAAMTAGTKVEAGIAVRVNIVVATKRRSTTRVVTATVVALAMATAMTRGRRGHRIGSLCPRSQHQLLHLRFGQSMKLRMALPTITIAEQG
jgi:hypothetical protein